MNQAYKLHNDRIYVLAEAPGGVYSTDQFKAIHDFCSEHDLMIKVSEDQRIGVVLPESLRDAFSNAMGEVGVMVRNYGEGLHQPMTCLGSHVAINDQDSLSLAIELTDKLLSLTTKAPLRIVVNGSSQSIIASQVMDISLIGNEKGFSVFLGGKNSPIPELASFIAEGVPAAEVSDLIVKTVTCYNELATEDETLYDVLGRCGMQPFVEIFAPYSQDAVGDHDPFAALDDAPVTSEQSSLDEDTLIDDLPAVEVSRHEENLTNSEMVEGDLMLDDEASPSLNPTEVNDEFINFEDLQLEDRELGAFSTSNEARLEAVMKSVSALEQNDADELAESSLENQLANAMDEQDLLRNLAVDENEMARESTLDLVENSVGFEDHVDDISHVRSASLDKGAFVDIVSVNLDEEFVNLNFATGASLSVEMNRLRDSGGKRKFTINGQEVSLKILNNKLHVQVDGLDFIVPEAA